MKGATVYSIHWPGQCKVGIVGVTFKSLRMSSIIIFLVPADNAASGFHKPWFAEIISAAISADANGLLIKFFISPNELVRCSHCRPRGDPSGNLQLVMISPYIRKARMGFPVVTRRITQT